MSAVRIDPLTGLVGLAVVGVGLWFVVRGVKGVTRDASKAAVDAAAGLVEGTVLGVGEAVGIPQTSLSACELALAEGRYWDASFACPAGDFVRGVFASRPPPKPAFPAGTPDNPL